ncbi:unnamed protein product [Ectocarpus sp. 4 AP-2014]
MDGGASSTDAFRMPAEGEELTTPFSEFVVRYGHTPRLVRNMAAIAGVAAELPPRMEEPYRLVYFVVTDQMRTTVAALRAVLKEGFQAPLRAPTAFIIDELHTLEVFRKQGLATSLTNFVKGIAEAHGVELFVSSELYIRSFWELRGFEEETSPEVLRACNLDLDDGFNTGSSTTLLRAGAAYTEYQPANDERLSMRTVAARGLLAIPSSGSRDGVVDLTGGSRSLAEQDEEQMQLAIAMSLSAAAAEATCGGGGDAAAAVAIERNDGARHDGAVRGGEGETSAGDDTETEEDADYGGQLSGGDADAAAGGVASTAAAAATAAAATAAAPTSSSTRSQVRAGEERSAGGGDGSGCGGGGGAWGRRAGGVVEDCRGHGRDNDNDNDGVSRRLRRRRDESGSSTPGEPSPCGADGAASVGMELDGVGAGRHGNEGRRSSSRDVGDDGNTASLTENVCITAARDVGSGLGVASETTAPHAPRPLDAAAAAAREGSSNRPSSLPPSRPASPCPSSASSCSFTLEPVPSRSRTSTWNQQQPTTVGELGHRDPNSAMTVSKENDPHHHHHHHHQDQARKAVNQPPPRGLGARGQQHQHQASFVGDGGGMIGALGGVIYPTSTAGGSGGADVSGLGAGRFGNVGVGGGGGGLISDGIEPSDVMMRDFGVGADGLDGGGRLDDKLIAVAEWEGDDADEELRRVMEASRQSHEEEMIQRATQESQQAAAAAAAAAEHLPEPPSNTAAPPPPPPSSLPPLSRKGVAATTPNGGGPDVAVLPSFGSLGARNGTGVGVGVGAGVHGHGSDGSGAALPSTCGGAAVSSGGFRAGTGGGAADSAAAAAAAAVAAGAQTSAWFGGWEDGEAVSFTGKGKGKGRCRD